MRSMPHIRIGALATAAALIAALGLPSAAIAGSASAAPASAIGSDQVPHYDHIAVVMDTAHDYGSIIGNQHAPNINRLARQYGLASRYFTTSDPGTANIMALLAGAPFAISDSVPYWDQQLRKSSLLSQLAAAHMSWREYAQGLPYPGYLGDCYPTLCVQTDSLYNQTQFNSVPDLSSVAGNPAQARNMVPAARLGTDAQAGRLPDFSLIDPDECHDMHGGPPWCEDSSSSYFQPDDNRLVAAGDSYIGQVVREIMAGPQWSRGNNAIVVTFTEGDTSAGCCDVKTGTGHVVTIVITSHGPRHLTDATPFNHYSLLRTIEDAFGLRCLRHACDKALVPMARLFGAKADPAASAGLAAAVAGPAARSAARPAAQAAATVASPWHQVASPNIGASDNDLAAIGGRSPRDIWAVGGLLPDANATIVRALSVHYNGKTWTEVPTPDVGSQANSLYGVAALPDGTAWAVGIYTQSSGSTARVLTEHWTGRRWVIVPAANPGARDDMLYGVAAVSDSDVWAIGTYCGQDGFFHPLIEHWNGWHWTVRSDGLVAADGILTSVTSAPAHSVWAAGQLAMGGPDRQLIVRLAGSGGPSVHARGLRAVSVYPQSIGGSRAGLWVAGNDRPGLTGFKTLVEGPGAGRQLRKLTTPDPTPRDNYLMAVAPVDGGSAAWALGYSLQSSTGNASSLIEFGTATGGWRIVPSPDPGAANGGNTFIDAVLAFGSRNIWAVGTFDGPSGLRTLILHYAGGAW
jgi:hypothetical protein